MEKIRTEKDLDKMCEEIAEGLSPEEKKVFADKLLGILLDSKTEARLDSRLARTILYLEAHDMLGSKFGVTQLIKASMILEPEKTIEAIEEVSETRKIISAPF